MSTDTTSVDTPKAASRDNSSTGSRTTVLGRLFEEKNPDSRIEEKGPDSRIEEKGPDSRVEEIGPDLEYGAVVAPLNQVNPRFNNLSWTRLTLLLIVEAIALGTLGMPSAFAVLGMVPGCLLSVGIGCIAMYTGYLVGKVKVNYPHVENYADAVRLFGGAVGYWVTNQACDC